jgi:hypothetical protein
MGSHFVAGDRGWRLGLRAPGHGVWGTSPERDRLVNKPGLWSKACRTGYLSRYLVENWTLVLVLQPMLLVVSRIGEQ